MELFRCQMRKNELKKCKQCKKNYPLSCVDRHGVCIHCYKKPVKVGDIFGSI